MEENEYLYDAFISYRHLPIDGWAAEKVHKTLETYQLPKALAKKIGKKGITRIFQDKEELVTSGDLANELDYALRRSRYLILICSSKTIESDWVMHEVQTFKELGRQYQILILLVEGEPEQTIPQILRTHDKKVMLADGSEVVIQEEIEPLAADIRGVDKRERSRKFKTEILRIIAPILGCSYDDLKERHKERRNKRIILGSAIAVLGLVAFGIYNSWRLSEIETQMNAKLATQSRSLADQSTRLLEKGDRMRALLVALEALPTDFEHPDRPIMKEVQYTLANALYTYNFDMGMRPDKTLEYTNVLSRVVLSPEATKAASISEDGHIQIWDMASSTLLFSKEEIGSMSLEDDFVQFVDEDEVLLCNEEKLQLLDAKSASVIWEKAITNSYFKLLNDNKVGIIGEGQLLILNTEDGSLVHSVTLPEEETVGKWVMTHNETKGQMLIGNRDHLWAIDLHTYELLKEEQISGYSVRDIGCTKQGEFIIMLNPLNEDIIEDVQELGTSKIMSVTLANKQLVTKWEREFPRGYLSKLRVSPTEGEPITVLQHQSFYLLDSTTGETLKDYTQGADIIDYAYVGENAYIATTKGEVKMLPFDETLFSMAFNFDHEGDLTSFDFEKGKVVMTGEGDKKIYVYRWLKGQEETQLSDDSEYIYKMGTSQDDQYVYTKDTQGPIKIYKDNGKTFVSSIQLEEDSVQQSFLKTTNYFYTMGYDDIKFWELSSGKEVKTVTPSATNPGILFQIIEDEEEQEIDCICQYGVLVLNGQDLEEKAFIPYEENNIEQVIRIGRGRLVIRDGGNKLSLMDTKKQSIEHIQEGVTNFAVDKELGLIGMVKENHTLQVLDEAEHQTIYAKKINEYSPIHYLSFEEGENRLWVGYEDTRVKIMDIKNDSEEEVAEELPYLLEDVECFKEQERVILTTRGEDKSKVSLVYDRRSLTRLADVYGLQDVNADCSYFYLVGSDGTSYVVPFYNTQQLAAEAVKQLEGRSLTNKEKRKFFIIE